MVHKILVTQKQLQTPSKVLKIYLHLLFICKSFHLLNYYLIIISQKLDSCYFRLSILHEFQEIHYQKKSFARVLGFVEKCAHEQKMKYIQGNYVTSANMVVHGRAKYKPSYAHKPIHNGKVLLQHQLCPIWSIIKFSVSPSSLIKPFLSCILLGFQNIFNEI